MNSTNFLRAQPRREIEIVLFVKSRDLGFYGLRLIAGAGAGEFFVGCGVTFLRGAGWHKLNCGWVFGLSTCNVNSIKQTLFLKNRRWHIERS